MEIGTLDIIILVIIAASAIWGMFKGFMKQIVSIVALLLGIWCASRFTIYLSAQVKELLSLSIEQNTLHIIVFVAIFIVVLILSNIAGKGIEGLIKLGMLGWFNHLLGFLFGGAKAAIILGALTYVINYVNDLFKIIPQSVFESSKGYAFIEQLAQEFFPFLHNIFS